MLGMLEKRHSEHPGIAPAQVRPKTSSCNIKELAETNTLLLGI